MTVREAAHVTHEISAEARVARTTLTLVGAAAGGAGAAYASGGAATVAGVSLGCSIGGAVGTPIDKAIGTSIVGEVVIGVKSILVGPDRQPAANNDPAILQAGCDGRPIAEGSLTVMAERWNFSRRGDQTMCGHIIVQGCETVLVGGAPSLGGNRLADFGGWFNLGVDLACQATGLKDAGATEGLLTALEMAATAGQLDSTADVLSGLSGTQSILSGEGVGSLTEGLLDVGNSALNLTGH